MYRKRKQLMELAVCGVDALAVIFSLFIAGMIRYHSLTDVEGKSTGIMQHDAGLTHRSILFSESI